MIYIIRRSNLDELRRFGVDRYTFYLFVNHVHNHAFNHIRSFVIPTPFEPHLQHPTPPDYEH